MCLLTNQVHPSRGGRPTASLTATHWTLNSEARSASQTGAARLTAWFQARRKGERPQHSAPSRFPVGTGAHGCFSWQPRTGSRPNAHLQNRSVSPGSQRSPTTSSLRASLAGPLLVTHSGQSVEVSSPSANNEEHCCGLQPQGPGRPTGRRGKPETQARLPGRPGEQCPRLFVRNKPRQPVPPGAASAQEAAESLSPAAPPVSENNKRGRQTPGSALPGKCAHVPLTEEDDWKHKQNVGATGSPHVHAHGTAKGSQSPHL